MSQITLDVPEPLLQHLAQRAAARNSTIEKVAIDELQLAMEPPSPTAGQGGSAADLPADIIERITSLERQADWDGEGADAISREACAAAIKFLQRRDRAVPLPRITPSRMGGVSLYWSGADQRILITITSSSCDHHYQNSGPAGAHDHGMARPEELLERLATIFRERN